MAFCVFSALQQKPRFGGSPSTDTAGPAHTSAHAGMDAQARRHERTQMMQSAHVFLWSRWQITKMKNDTCAITKMKNDTCAITFYIDFSTTAEQLIPAQIVL